MPRPLRICQLCDAVAIRRMRPTRTAFTAPNPLKSRGILLGASRGVATKTSTPANSSWQASAVTKSPKGSNAAVASESNANSARLGGRGTPSNPRASRAELSSLTDMMAYLENSKTKVTGHDNRIPPEADVSAALQACRVVADYITDESVQPQINHMVNELDSTAANLLSLEGNESKSGAPVPSSRSSNTGAIDGNISTQVRQMIDKISDAAYAIVAHPTVFITPSLLRQYVEVQAVLGRPETLPKIFQLYVSKPVPSEASGSVSYAKQNPNKAANAIDSEVIETALDTAVEAKNLDAAVGIIENSYTTPAFIRAKLLQKALVPCTALAATPLAAYGLASNFSILQNAMDPAMATKVAFTGILAYVGFTVSIGVVAVATANDQMRRVTWAPGIPLRMRWVREEERAALDRVACAWGFQEQWRQGEEEGTEWESLREYIGQKGMVLDRTELMEGME
ncbi:hypothetical protein PG994_010342 [Apiospora phragmitis]|uniref:Uncharacterized protein n=1 Tax=Apiospora phragmitis TaxID=2905665 RepID=A0ABR1TPU6_9PEZI